MSDFVIEDGVLKKYTGNDKKVIIPNGVTSIGDWAFSSCSALSSIKIASSVTSIGNDAFWGCSSLSSVEIPAGVTSIGSEAFRGCSSLRSVEIPDGVTSIGESAFICCSSLSSVKIPDSVTSIGDWVFSGCSSLKSVKIPDSVTDLGGAIFHGCKKLGGKHGFVVIRGILLDYVGEQSGVIIPAGVTSIGRYAFYRCGSLKSVKIPDSVTGIGGGAFDDCSSLKSVEIPDSVTSIGDSAFTDCSSLKSVKIPDSVTSIGSEAFWGCSSLSNVEIPSSVTSIGKYAFKECSSLNSVRISDSATSIGEKAFKDCSSLNSVRISDSATGIGERAFEGCGSLNRVEIPESITSIGEKAFHDCSSLSSVEISEGVTSIGSDAFWGCSSLSNVKIPSSVMSIGDGAFKGCKSLSSVEIPDSVTYFGCNIFSGCKGLVNKFTNNGFVIISGLLYKCKSKKQNVIIPFGVTGIGGKAFYDCSSLISVEIPSNVTSIGDWAFANCSSLSSVEIPSSVTNIGVCVFANCSSLNSVEFLTGVTSIGSGAFIGCSSLNSVVIPSSVTGINKTAFEDCTSLSVVKAEETDELFQALKKSKSKNLQAVLPWQPDESISSASEEQVSDIIKEIGVLEKDKKEGKWKALALIGKLLYNDTPAAMRFAEKRGLLDEYAKLRGVTADELREQNMSSFGLDGNGECRWTLAGREIIARLNADLVLTLTDGKSGKIIKSIPKKDADPAAYEAANAAYKDMKKSLSEMIKIWGSKLFAEFLSGESRSSERWQKLFLGNPMMRGLGRLLVWTQSGDTFTLHEDGKPYDVSGNAYILTDAPVAVAHPMEMKQEEVAAWQDYFLANSLKQPFEQVWEPVVDASLVKANRYDGCPIELYRLMNKDKHGIVMKGQSKLELRDCTAKLEFVEEKSEWVDNLFEVKNFKYDTYTRQVNHIVVLLDRGTMEGRIAKDDISAMALLDEFTAAQITDFIRVASENHADNVTASLLAYKNNRFPEIDPMAEFTLDF